MKRWNVISGVASTLFVASILTFGFSTEIASAHGKACKGHHKNDCNGGGGGGSGVTYTAERTEGVLSFGPVIVIPNEKQNSLFADPNTADLKFFRPGPGSNFDIPNTASCAEHDDTAVACQAYDDVFLNCDILRTAMVVPSRFTVSAENLSVQEPGGIGIALGGIDVLDASGNPFVGLHLQLIGLCFNDDGCTDDFVPVPAEDDVPVTKIVPLTYFVLTGHTVKVIKPRGHCNKDGHTGDLAAPSTLVITAAKCTGGASLTGLPGIPPACAPTVTIDSLTTDNATPELTGAVSDPSATITVTVNSIVYDGDLNNGDGTWTLAGGTIAPPLAVATYDVIVSADNGQIGMDTTNNELMITAPPP